MALSGRPDNTTSTTLTNDGFWPDVALSELLDKYRVSGEYADDVVKEQLKFAIVQVNDQLKTAKAAVIALEYTDLDAYLVDNSNEIDGQEVLVFYYIRACCCFAKAHCLQQAKTLNRTPTAENMAKESDETQSYWLGQGELAVSNLLAAFFPDDDFIDATRPYSVLI